MRQRLGKVSKSPEDLIELIEYTAASHSIIDALQERLFALRDQLDALEEMRVRIDENDFVLFWKLMSQVPS